MKYKIVFSIYGCKNSIEFKYWSQYSNWIEVMRDNFGEQFVFLDIFDLDHERRKKNEKT